MFDVTINDLLSLVVILYVASGGLRAVAYVDTMVFFSWRNNCSWYHYFELFRGFNNLIEGIAVLSQADTKLIKKDTVIM